MVLWVGTTIFGVPIITIHMISKIIKSGEMILGEDALADNRTFFCLPLRWHTLRTIWDVLATRIDLTDVPPTAIIYRVACDDRGGLVSWNNIWQMFKICQLGSRLCSSCWSSIRKEHIGLRLGMPRRCPSISTNTLLNFLLLSSHEKTLAFWRIKLLHFMDHLVCPRDLLLVPLLYFLWFSHNKMENLKKKICLAW